MFRRLLVSLPVIAGATLLSVEASAQDKKDCEPGSWFCGETAPPGKDLQPLPGDKDTKADDGKKSTPPPPVVVYQPPPPTVVVQARDAPPAYYYVPRKAPPKKEWGINLHAGGATMGSGRDGNSAMGLVGLGVRFRPVPIFAMEADLDFAGGTDYNGFRRNETAFTLNGLIFLNPKNKAQVYLLGGIGWSGARAVDDRRGFDEVEYKYGYFGVQGGVGIEFRLSRVVALNFDVRGLVRGRVDDNRHQYPEFVDQRTGRSTNTSGAGIFQGGLTFYW